MEKKGGKGGEMSWYARGTVDPNDVSPSPSFFNLHFLLRNNGEQLVVQMEETPSTLETVLLSGFVLLLFCPLLPLNRTADPINQVRTLPAIPSGNSRMC